MELTDRDIERFKSKVIRGDSPDGCWRWTGSAFKATGYSLFNMKMPDGVWRPTVAHRVSYEIFVGPIPEKLRIDHLCRNRACTNPRHLEPVTDRINIARGMAPSAVAHRTDTCLNGHPLTPENSYVRPSRPNKRECRICMAEREKGYKQVIDKDAFYAEERTCPQGHLFDEANTYWAKTLRHLCRRCMNERRNRYRKSEV